MGYRKLKPLLWRTTAREKPCWFFGTMHWPDDWERRLPKSLLATVDACDALCVEYIVDGSETPNADDFLGERNTRRLVNAARTAQRTTGEKQAILTILDQWLGRRMHARGGLVYQLESRTEQEAALDTLCGAYQLSPKGLTLQELNTAYLGRDLEAMHQLEMSIWTEPAATWANRHVRMARRLLDLFRETPETSYMVAIGLSHLTGPTSVLDLIDLGSVPTEKDGW